MSHFFLSYARGDDDDYVERFYLDLCREIRVREGLPRGERVGFMDNTSIRIGTEWSAELVSALTECGVFLPMYAPGYFLSESCGREWAAFEHRLRQHPGAPDTAGGFVPVVWLEPPFLPPVAKALQYRSSAFGGAYAEYGLRQLIRLRRHEDDYRETVSALAREIVRIAGRHAPRAAGLDVEWAGLPSAFHVPTPAARPRITGATAPPSPAPLRQPPSDSGGSNGTDRPSAPREERIDVREVAVPRASDEPRTGEPAPLDGSRHVHSAIASTEHDEMRSVHTVSNQDAVTWEHDDNLSRTVPETFPNQRLRSDPTSCPEVRTPEQFSQDLDQALQIALNRLMRRGQVFRVPPNPTSAPRAILEGPESMLNEASS